MLRSASEIIGSHMAAVDGEIGKACDLLFDDQKWTVRHLVVDTGKWLPGRKVLIAPEALGDHDWKKRSIPVSLTKENIENSPSLDTDKPVSRQHEADLYRYFAWTPYWGVGMAPYPAPTVIDMPEKTETEVAEGDPHLRSVKDVKGHHVSAVDGEVGHIDDFILDDQTWILRYAVVATRHWLPGRKLLLSPLWFESIDWAEGEANTIMRRTYIENSPEFDPHSEITREYEERLYDFYAQPKYWTK